MLPRSVEGDVGAEWGRVGWGTGSVYFDNVKIIWLTVKGGGLKEYDKE